MPEASTRKQIVEDPDDARHPVEGPLAGIDEEDLYLKPEILNPKS